MSLAIFLHAFRLVFQNLGQALRISALLYAVPTLLSVIVVGATPIDPHEVDVGGIFLRMIPVAIVNAISFLWLTVAWHRFILLDEEPAGIIPPFRGDRILSYVGHGFILTIIAIPILLVAMILAMPLVMAAAPFAMLIPFACMLVVGFLFYRVGAYLPAAAIGKTITVREAWAATKGATGTIAGLTALTLLFGVLINIPRYLAIQFGNIQILYVWTFVSVVGGWIILLVSIGILSTIYGHYVEGRPLPAQ